MTRESSTYELFGEPVELLKFSELENRIRQIVEEHNLLKRRIEELEECLKNRELELAETNNKMKGLDEERNSVRDKVDSLLDLLQDISTQP
ncbi:MAG: hypothetical protein U1C55_03920 [Smithellaceae bacterium]|nr:hypothetical protein [Smithellaceae bacterium]